MSRLLKMFFLVWLAVFLQSALTNIITIWGLVPDFIIIIVALVALKDGASSGVWIGLLAGFLSDCYHPSTMGLFSASGVAAGYLAGQAREKIYREQLLSQVALISALSLIRQLFGFFGRDGGQLSSYWHFLFRYGLGGAFFTGAIAAVLLPGLNGWLYGKKQSYLSKTF